LGALSALFGDERQVDVIGPELIGVQPAACILQCLTEPMQLRKIVLFAEEARPAVVAAFARCARAFHPRERAAAGPRSDKGSPSRVEAPCWVQGRGGLT